MTTTSVPSVLGSAVPAPTLMHVFATSIGEVGRAVAGEHGDKIRQLGSQSGFVANTVRRVIGLLIELLRLVAHGLRATENLVRGTDAVLALATALLDSVDALGAVLRGTASLVGPQTSGPNRRFDFGSALTQAKGILPVDVLEDALPAVHEIVQVRSLLSELLQDSGADTNTRGHASLVVLAQTIQQPSQGPAATDENRESKQT